MGVRSSRGVSRLLRCWQRHCLPRRREQLQSPECRWRPGSAGARQHCEGGRGYSGPESLAVRVPAVCATPSWTAGCGSEKFPAVLRWLLAAASPRLVPVPRSHPPGPAGAAGAGTGKTTQIALQWVRRPRGAGSHEPPPRGAFSARDSQMLGPTWAWRGRLVEVRDPARRPRWAQPNACLAAQRPNAEGRMWPRKWLENSGSPALPLLSGLWCSD